MKRRQLLLGLSLAALVASQAQAQVVTDIAPDGDAGFGTGTTVVTNGTQTQISGGEVSGTNLFHSFAQFDLANGDIATWVRGAADANSITNIINRVRSGTPSNIDGTITVADMPNADFWFINPAGVVFGDGASVQVPNAAYFSTAQEIGFGGGQRFSTVTPDGSTFSSAPPQAFGFLGGSAAISFSGWVNSSSDMTLVGADVTVDGTLITFGTRFEAIAVGDGAETISLSNPAQVTGNGQISFLPGTGFGGSDVFLTAENILLDDTNINVIGAEGIRFNGGRVVIDNGSQITIRDLQIATDGIHITADSLEIDNFSLLATSSNSTTTQDAGGITIDVGNLLITSSKIETRTSGLGLAGDISITADNATFTNSTPENLDNRSEIGSIASTGGSSSGNITIDVTERLIVDASLISNTTFGSGDGGVIAIRAQDLEMINAGSIFAGTDFGTGNSGSIIIDVDNLVFGPRTADNTTPSIEAATSGSGDAGTITITANNLAMGTDGQISTSTLHEATGNAGAIQITADVMTMEGGGIVSAARAGQSANPGDAGTVSINVGTFEMVGGSIDSNTLNSGNAGDVIVVADNLSMSGLSRISAATVSDGDAGTVNVSAENMLLVDGSAQITANTSGAGNAGSVNVTAPVIEMYGDGRIASTTEDSGNGGTINVQTDSLFMTGAARIDSTARVSGSGNAGAVNVVVDGDLSMTQFAEISSNTEGVGNGGSVSVSARDVFMRDIARLSSSTFGDGNAGSLTLTARNLDIGDNADIVSEAAQINQIYGTGNAGSVSVDIDETILMSGIGLIGASTFTAGDAGAITVSAGQSITMIDQAVIESKTADTLPQLPRTNGNSGSIQISTSLLEMTGSAAISARAEGEGAAGNVAVVVDELAMDRFSRINASTFGEGDAGSVRVNVAGALTLTDQASIDAITFGSGNAGSVIVDADTVSLNVGAVPSDFSRISSNSEGSGDAGSVEVNARLVTVDDGVINSITTGAGDAGQVRINAEQFSMSQGFVSSTTQGEGDAGIVEVFADSVTITGGAINSISQAAGDAGEVYVETSQLTMTGGFISSSVLSGSSGQGGNVQVVAENADLSGNAVINAQAIAGSTGDAGNVSIHTNTLLSLTDDAKISTGTDGPGLAGNIFIAASDVLVDGNARITSETTSSGDAGSVEFDVTNMLWLRGDSRVTSSTDGIGNTGDAGSVTIRGGTLRIDEDAQIDSSTREEALGDAGLVDIAVDLLEMTGGFIYTSTYGAGDAGTLGVDAGEIRLSGTGTINSRAVDGSSGNAGNVRVFASDLVTLADDSSISASTSGPGSAGSVSVETPLLTMTGGSIDSSTTNAGNAGNVVVSVGNAQLLGNARITSNALTGSTGLAGKVLFNATGFLDIHDNAGIIAGTRGEGNAGLVSVQVGELFMDGGAIASSTEAAGDAGDVLISGNVIAITGDAKVNSGALQGSTGHAGFVQIFTPNFLFVGGDAVISASTAGPGDAGAVLITADNLQMDGGEIASFTRGAGDAGLVLIDAGSAVLDGGATINSLADGPNTGDAGDVFIKVGSELVVANGATVAASTFGVGNAGEVNVTAGNLVLNGGQIASATSGSGDAGDVNIAADDLLLMPFSSIDSRSEAGATGDAGDVVVDVSNTLRLEVASAISASSVGDGFAGTVEIHAGILDMLGGAINSFTAGSGDAGLVGVFVDELNMSGGRIDSASDSPLADAGDAGSVFIAAGTASLSGDAQIDSRASTGDAGDVTLVVSGRLEVSEDGQVSAATTGSGQAGLVQVFADELIMTGGAINSFTNGSGNAGLVDVTARVIDMSGGRIDSSSDSHAPDAGDAGGVLVRGNDVRLSGNALIDSRGITGDAGDVSVEVLGDLSMADEAQISAATDGSGDAGSVFVLAELLTMTGGEINSITTGSGDAGLVAVEVDELVMTGGRITSAAQNAPPVANLSASIDPLAMPLPPPAGDAGDVFLRANNAMLDGSASIDSTSEGSTAGTVQVLIDQDLLLFNGAQISTTAFGAGDAGDITIAADNLVLDNFSQISSTAARNFSAGTIEITAQEIRILNGSEISTNSENGPAGDIGLFLPLDGFLYLAGRDPGVITTSSGANTGGQIIISDPFLILSEGGSILALGQQGGANVQIQSAFFIRSSDRINLVSVDGSLLIESNVGEQITGTEVADIPFLDASGILSGQCTGVRQGGEVSQFSSRVTGPYAPPDTADEAEDEVDSGSPDQIALVEQGALAPCG